MLAAPTIAGRRAGSVTVRSTCHGDAPSAAAACPGRGSSASQATPTVRTTTATLKKTSPQTMATGVPSRPSEPSGPPSPSSWRKATPTTTVGRTNGTSSAARTAARPGRASRWRAYAAGRPRTTARMVATPEVHTVNQATRCTRGRASTSSTAPGAKRPSSQNPSATMPVTGSTKSRPSTSTGPAASSRSPSDAGGSSRHDVGPLGQPLLAVRGDVGGRDLVGVGRLRGELRPVVGHAWRPA